MTRTEETPRSSYRERILCMKGVMGSLSLATSSIILSSRIMKLVAQVSSSTRRVLAPTSRASTILLAWLVLPLASAEEKQSVPFPKGRLDMKGLMSTAQTALPSSALILQASSSQTTNSLPSPGILSYTPNWRAESSVDLPWNPPPTIRVTPFRIPMPVTFFWRLGRSNETFMLGGDSNRTTGSLPGASAMGRSSAPDARGSTAPSGTNATRPAPSNRPLNHRWSSTDSTWRCNLAPFSADDTRAFLTNSGTARSKMSAAF
mmetsp:Transcript_28844/g.59056  ORF Transcript_28844/g.59056 Transcript_28844/m.59056 type:complete len:261 (+) Transcript_28844:416-1198(+)